MATSRTEDFRRSVRDLTILATRDLRALLGPEFDPRDAKRLLEQILPDLVHQYGSAAGTVAADYYDDMRNEAKAPGRFSPVLHEPDTDSTDGLVRWALGEATSGQAFQELVLGGVQRRIANASRGTIMYSALGDPRARGWMRIGAGACDFCAMLIARGAVYRTEQSVQFAAHDHCHCGYAPAFNDAQIREVNHEFVHSARRRSDETKAANAARARDWMNAHL